MEIVIPLNTTKPLTVNAVDEFSTDILAVEEKQQYQFLCDDRQQWTDWFITTTPDGYFNLPAWILGQRVKHVKCFCLCGAYNKRLSTGFPIGKQKVIVITESGFLSLFANDSAGFYKNNKGNIKVDITRLK